ncbi:hypothetical protein BUALT_Bualt15G0036900 [Buddleja alternifolia]|uniref:Protein kinase domain-containing protein n=1 Tax=Buddleja alternifolia TaxID=168488 RepID=A0AAV6WMZ1_9LAMI|nr:hypothetical protein BUALT_Bualt15G0036900 [Buddleja alternifolia]
MNSNKSTQNLHLFRLSSLFLLLLVPAYGLNLDGTLLLSFKYSVLSDPLSVLDNWDYNDANPCLWRGVICAQVENTFPSPDMFRVISLTLPNSKLLELQTLSLSNNVISGTIPESISGLKSLKLLNLSDNALAGNLPKSLTSLQNLTVVSLRSNYFTGPIPSSIQSFQVFDLSSNLLNGSLPLDFGGENLNYLNLSSNKLSGFVPREFATKIPPHATIDLSFNELSGEIPESTPLSNQEMKSYSGNADLCGKPLKKLCSIPSTLSNPPNASLNSSSPAIAAIPKTLNPTPLPNSPSTTQISPQHGLKPGAIAGIAVGDLAGIGILAVIFLYIYQKKKSKSKSETESKPKTNPNSTQSYVFNTEPAKETRNLPNWPCLTLTHAEEASTASSETEDDPAPNDAVSDQNQQIKNRRSLTMVDGETELELETLLKASAYVIGSSGASIVYKAVLQNGAAFAVRRIGESGVQRMKEFENQVRTIAKMRHQNLVRVRGFYWGDDEKLVIHDYVSNGSLANVGFTRLKIAKGVAKGLNYIHEKKNVHGNIKPSNILLTQDMEPIISDFGLNGLIHGKHRRKPSGSARHFGSKRSASSGDDPHDHTVNFGSPYVGPPVFVGCTSPYHAPESLNSLKPNPKWDVYSFGILLLELLTGKVFSDRELSQWTAGSVAEDPSRVLRMADVAIRGDVAGREEAMLAWFKLGFSCASLVPQKRPCMRDAINVLEKIPCCSN